MLGAPERVVASSRISRLLDRPPGHDVVEGAIVPAAVRCQIETYDPADDKPFDGWKAGVYGRDGDVCPSSLADRHWTRITAPFAPAQIAALAPERRRGEAVYGGLLFHHYGRFLLESTSRLWWPLRQAFDGPIVFQNTRRSQPLPDFAQRFFDLMGVSDRIVVVDRPLAFDRMVVPHRAFVIQKHLHAAFRLPFLEAGRAAESHRPWRAASFKDATGIYLSRTQFEKRRSFGEKHVEEAFARAGFGIVHTQTLPLEQQILLVQRHTRIAGIAGSAFHNLLFAPESRRPVYICRDYDINPNFFMIDELMENEATYVFSPPEDATVAPRSSRATVDAYWDDVTLDSRKVASCLKEAGVLTSAR